MARAPDTEADVLALVSRRTYSLYAAGKDRARASGAGSLPVPGSYNAVSRVAASSSDSGSDEFDAWNGRGAGSGQASSWVNVFGVGMALL